MKPKGVTTQMKAHDEYILMVLFVSLLKSLFSCIRNLKGVTTHMKALDEYNLMVLLVSLLKRVHFLVYEI